MSSKRPRSGGKAGDRKDKSGKRDFGGRAVRNQPKFKDTAKAKNIKNELADIQDKLRKAQKEYEALTNKVKVVRSQPRAQLKDKDSINDRIAKLKKRIVDKKAEIDKTKEENKRLQEIANNKRSALTKLKGNVFYTRINEADYLKKNIQRQREEINALERQLETSSLSLPEEKKIIKEIKRIKSLKQHFKPYQKKAAVAQEAMDKFIRADREQKKKAEAIKNWEEEILRLKANLITLAEKENQIKDDHEKEKKKEAEKEKKEVDEKTKIQDKITELAKQMRIKNEELYDSREQFYSDIRKEREQLDEQMNMERAKRREDREKEEREQAVADREAKKSVVPFSREMASCTNLINYLSRYMPSQASDEKKQEKKQEDSDKKDDKNRGYIKGRDEPEDIFGFGVKKNKKNKKKRNKKRGKKSNTDITHSLDTFARFSELKVGNVPVTRDQVPEAIEKIRAKLADLKKQSNEKRAIILKEVAADEKADKEREEKRKQREAEEKKEEKKGEEQKKEDSATKEDK